MVLQKVQYCTNLYKRISSSAKTLQFIAQFNQEFFDGVHFTENCRVFAELGIQICTILYFLQNDFCTIRSKKNTKF
ncbi:hypothetical protein BpHYR1_011112 [Brachionus plicatilis]|uniref:Uncharacterized protein n=1 Tax=Brachionus plicatilis TaxID=10195 RepID=A0A3M7QBE6_BRAPC|nr:hypothetical protein BpHYR1_011112 [Brachionus plicatilis]